MMKNLCIVALLLSITGCASTVYQTKFDLKDNEDRSHIVEQQYYLPRALVSFNAAIDEHGDATITLSPKIVPDTTKRLYLVRHHSVFYDDNFVIQTTPEGLLTAINTKTTYKGVEITQKLGELAASAIPMVPLAEERQLEPAQECPPPKPVKLEIEIDPFDLTAANELLKNYCFSFSVTSIKGDPINSTNYLDKDTKPNKKGRHAGIAYRDTIQVILTVEYTAKDHHMKKLSRLSIPDISTIAYAPVRGLRN